MSSVCYNIAVVVGVTSCDCYFLLFFCYFFQVFEVRARGRTGEENFVTCMRKALGSKYGDKPVSMGGVFSIVRGTAKLHVMV